MTQHDVLDPAAGCLLAVVHHVYGTNNAEILFAHDNAICMHHWDPQCNFYVE
jgi:hypothetical protein